MFSKDGSIPLTLLYYYTYKLVEQLIRNARVGCSSHPGGTISFQTRPSFLDGAFLA